MERELCNNITINKFLFKFLRCSLEVHLNKLPLNFLFKVFLGKLLFYVLFPVALLAVFSSPSSASRCSRTSSCSTSCTR